MSAARSYGAIHAGRRQRGLDDDDVWRDFLERETGKRSLREMTDAELGKVKKAVSPGAAHVRPGKRLTGPYASKLQALWLSGWNLGVVRDRRDAALLSFLARQTGLQRTEFLRDPADARKAIEALKSWLEREGGVDWSKHDDPQDAVLAAQVKILNAAPQVHIAGTASPAVRGLAKVATMQLMGEQIRERADDPSR